MVACLKCFYAVLFLSLSSFNVSSQQAFSEALIKDGFSHLFLPCGFGAKEIIFSMLFSDASCRGTFITL